MRPKKVVLMVDSSELSLWPYVLRTRGYAVFPFATGEEALEMLRSRPLYSVDLLITDAQVLDFEGNVLATCAKQLHPRLPVLIYSRTLQNYERGAQADYFIPKSMLNSEELVVRVELLCRRKRGPRKSDHLVSRTQPEVAHA